MNLINPITNEQMALKYTHVCLIKPVFMMLKYTHKSGGKVSKKIELKEHVVVHFPSRP